MMTKKVLKYVDDCAVTSKKAEKTNKKAEIVQNNGVERVPFLSITLHKVKWQTISLTYFDL